MNTKTTIIVEDSDKLNFRTRLNEVLARYQDNRIYNIDTGVVHNGYDSRGQAIMYYYAILIVTGDAMHYDFEER